MLIVIADIMEEGRTVLEFDTERTYAIADHIREQLDKHATLLSRTDDSLFRDLIRISRQWWLEWLGAGLHDIARDTECDALKLAFMDRLAVLETAMVGAGGMASFDLFVVWARSEMPDYLAPMVWEEEDA